MTRLFPTRSVRAKIILVVLATTLTALTVTAIALTVYDLITYERSRVADLDSLAGIIARASAPALTFDDPKSARENLAMLRERPTITAAAIYDHRGALFASLEQVATGSSPPGSAFQIQLASIPQSNGYRIEGGQISIFQRIIENNEPVGTIYIRALYEPLLRLNDYLTIMITVMLASLGIAALLSIWLQRRITEPIFEVTAVARHVIERRDFSIRVQKRTSDEIGVLVEAFNEMLAEVGRRAESLEEFNRILARETQVRRRAEDALRETDRRKDEFLATLAHELRNPLAPLRNALEILRVAGGNPVAAAAARDMMERQLRQMIRLVDDLLDVSRITTGKLVIQKERVELESVITSALETVRPLIEAQKQVLTVEFPPHAVHIEADPIRLAQVFSNLLNNAAKYTDPGGKISLRAECTAANVTVTVTDTGIGISAHMLPKIFEMFSQVDSSLERAHAGLGVGLTLARRLIELHGGTLEARSEGLGRGSQFVVCLPLLSKLQGEDGNTHALATSTPAPVPGRRILLVDDNVDFAMSLATLLRSLGHEVEVAHDGAQALKIVETFSPEFAFLDIGLPELNGYDLALRLRQQAGARDTLLVAITGWGQDRDRQRSREAGFEHHLVKPVEISQLEGILRVMR